MTCPIPFGQALPWNPTIGIDLIWIILFSWSVQRFYVLVCNELRSLYGTPAILDTFSLALTTVIYWLHA